MPVSYNNYFFSKQRLLYSFLSLSREPIQLRLPYFLVQRPGGQGPKGGEHAKGDPMRGASSPQRKGHRICHGARSGLCGGQRQLTVAVLSVPASFTHANSLVHVSREVG